MLLAHGWRPRGSGCNRNANRVPASKFCNPTDQELGFGNKNIRSGAIEFQKAETFDRIVEQDCTEFRHGAARSAAGVTTFAALRSKWVRMRRCWSGKSFSFSLMC